MKHTLLLLFNSILLTSLVSCHDWIPKEHAPANGALVATETTCDGFHARFALIADSSVTDRDPSSPVVRGVRWTMEVNPLAGVGTAPILTMESFTVHNAGGEHRYLGSFPPMNPTPPWQWSGTVGITALAGGVQRGDYVSLFPSFVGGGATGLSVAWLGLDVVPQDTDVAFDAARVIKLASCHTT